MQHNIKNKIYITFALTITLLVASCANKETKKEEPIITAPESAVTEQVPKKKLSSGEKAFLLCAACHNLQEGEPNKVGPNLYGIFGRKAASLEDFTYSEALKNSDIVWNEEHIRNWLEKPSDYVPGTTMAFIGIQNEEQQTALIEYLKEQTK